MYVCSLAVYIHMCVLAMIIVLVVKGSTILTVVECGLEEGKWIPGAQKSADCPISSTIKKWVELGVYH